jgi:hypothetical protein
VEIFSAPIDHGLLFREANACQELPAGSSTFPGKVSPSQAIPFQEQAVMKRILFAVGVACSLCAVGWAPGQARAEELEPKIKDAVNKGLDWLAKQQHRDGHWEAAGGQYAPAMTGVSGMALLMEGSTIREGKYANNIQRAVNWFMARSQPNGLLCNPGGAEAGRYMYGHGFGLLFLATVYGEEEDDTRRRKLEEILTRAVQFTGKAQTNRGGWGYVSAADGGNFDEGSVTITQMQAVRAARNAGIVVPKEIIDKGIKYLKDSTNGQGGVIYSLAGGGGGDGRPALTAAAISCGFSAGEYNSELVKRWFKFCQTHIPITTGGGFNRFGHDEYTHYYYSQAMYILGDEGWAKLFSGAKESDSLTWSKYRKATFDNLLRSQGSDGSWNGGHVGPVFITAVHLSMLQLDKATLPIYQR